MGCVSRNSEIVFLHFTKIECVGTFFKFFAGFSCHNITEKLTFRQERKWTKINSYGPCVKTLYLGCAAQLQTKLRTSMLLGYRAILHLPLEGQ